MKWAVFLDRDGTINEEVEYLGDPRDLRLSSGAIEGIRLLNQAGVSAIVISNQAGVGRGYFSVAAVEAVHQRLEEQLSSHEAHVDAIYYCPHHPEDGCDCRKPKSGLVKRAAEDHGIDLGSSFIVGDKETDLEAGRRVGCRTVLVLTGYGLQEREALKGGKVQPDHISADLLDAVKWILAQQDAERNMG
ncbi:MAG: HAD family hydrolase [Chloroflexi bacterium]|nr:HAD family hydrolase [Chloroflexota bacterium]